MYVSNHTREASIGRLATLLSEAISDPGTARADSELREALVSQGALAGFSRADIGIAGMALNTQKRVAAESLEGGYQRLNRLRLVAQAALADPGDRETLGRKDTKAGLKHRVDELEDLVRRLEQDLGLLTNAFEKLRAAADAIIRSVSLPRKYTLWINELKVVMAGLSLRQIGAGNVTPLKRR